MKQTTRFHWPNEQEDGSYDVMCLIMYLMRKQGEPANPKATPFSCSRYCLSRPQKTVGTCPACIISRYEYFRYTNICDMKLKNMYVLLHLYVKMSSGCNTDACVYNSQKSNRFQAPGPIAQP